MTIIGTWKEKVKTKFSYFCHALGGDIKIIFLMKLVLNNIFMVLMPTDHNHFPPSKKLKISEQSTNFSDHIPFVNDDDIRGPLVYRNDPSPYIFKSV